jgi:hypothetical protein
MDESAEYLLELYDVLGDYVVSVVLPDIIRSLRDHKDAVLCLASRLMVALPVVCDSGPFLQLARTSISMVFVSSSLLIIRLTPHSQYLLAAREKLLVWHLAPITHLSGLCRGR